MMNFLSQRKKNCKWGWLGKVENSLKIHVNSETSYDQTKNS